MIILFKILSNYVPDDSVIHKK